MSRYDKPVDFTVTGRGEFPFDMLRHDCAWPRRTEDALTIGSQGRRTIHLTARSVRDCTPARWWSFGWSALIDDPDIALLISSWNA